MTRNSDSGRVPLLGSQSETVVEQWPPRLGGTCGPPDTLARAHILGPRSASSATHFQAVGNNEATPPLSLPFRPRPQL